MLTYSLLETLFETDAFGEEVKPTAVEWVRKLDELCRDVKGSDSKRRKLKQVEWQQQVEDLFARVDLADLLKFVDFDRLKRNVKLVENGARSLRFKFPEVEGLPKEYVFGRQIFALEKGRSVVPHGHNNMATAFLMLEGECQGRHYDRVEDAEDHLVIRPTIDRRFKPAGYSTVSDNRDNVHWFQAVDGPAFIFNIHVLNVDPESRLTTGRVYVDPNGEKLKGGLIKAPRIDHKQAHRLYG